MEDTPKKKQKNEELPCHLCASNFPSKSHLSVHYYKAHHYCKRCEQDLISTQGALKHVEKMHSEEGICKHCTYYTFDPIVMKIHMNKKHKITFEKPTFNCPQCEYVSQQRNNIVLHCFAMHDYCDNCQMDLKSRKETLKHMVESHQIQVKCTKCSFQSVNPSSLQRHIDNHGDKRNSKRGAPCPHCNHIAHWAYDLRKHCFAKHNFCYECDEKMKSKEEMFDHMELEHGEQVRCQFCEYANVRPQNVLKHMKDSHPKKFKTLAKKAPEKPNYVRKEKVNKNEKPEAESAPPPPASPPKPKSPAKISITLNTSSLNGSYKISLKTKDEEIDLGEHKASPPKKKQKLIRKEENYLEFSEEVNASRYEDFIYNPLPEEQIVPQEDFGRDIRNVMPSSAYKYACPRCHSIKRNPSDMKTHCYSVHSHCWECKLDLKDKIDTFEHMEAEHELMPRCHLCPFVAFKCPRVIAHLHKEHGFIVEKKPKEAKKYICRYCDKNFPNGSSLNKHYRFSHNHCARCDLAYGEDKLGFSKHLEEEHEFMKLQCEKCSFIGLSNHAIQTHYAKEHPRFKRKIQMFKKPVEEYEEEYYENELLEPEIKMEIKMEDDDIAEDKIEEKYPKKKAVGKRRVVNKEDLDIEDSDDSEQDEQPVKKRNARNTRRVVIKKEEVDSSDSEDSDDSEDSEDSDDSDESDELSEDDSDPSDEKSPTIITRGKT